MNEFNEVFDGDLAERVFLVASVGFVALYACGILLLWRITPVPHLRTVYHGSTAIMALLLAIAISTVTGGLKLFHSSAHDAAIGADSPSILELQSSAAVKSLPTQKIKDATFVFDDE